ncbi:MAG: universal stress protein [Peptococcaceae bacterium]|nr:universal stress protein [Peptococcaceae bacterium]
MYKKILVPTDGSVMSDLAVEEALKMAKHLGAEVTVLNVTPDISPFLIGPYSGLPSKSLDSVVSEMGRNSKEIIEKVEKNYKDRYDNFNTKVLSGDPAFAICNEAKEGGYDLIIMANRGLGEIKQFLMGSVSRRVVKHADCSVLIFR